MNRFIYWIKNRLGINDSHCSGFCITCDYFNDCEEDLCLMNASKSKEKDRQSDRRESAA